MIDTESEPGAWEREMGLRPKVVTVRYDLSPAEIEGKLRDGLKGLGWLPPEDNARLQAALTKMLAEIDSAQTQGCCLNYETIEDARAALAGKDREYVP